MHSPCFQVVTYALAGGGLQLADGDKRLKGESQDM